MDELTNLTDLPISLRFVLLSIVAGMIYLVLYFLSRKPKVLRTAPRPAYGLELPIMRCKRGTYEHFDMPALR